MPKSNLTPLARLLSKIRIDPITGCWLWQSYCMKGGYGRFCLDGRCILAHRASWALHNGKIPDRLDVLHNCDTPPCINPSHLYLGDDFDNVADKMSRGRDRYDAPKGMASGLAKLTDAQVIQIRDRWTARTKPQAAIAAEFGVSQSLISMIGRRKLWAHI